METLLISNFDRFAERLIFMSIYAFSGELNKKKFVVNLLFCQRHEERQNSANMIR